MNYLKHITICICSLFLLLSLIPTALVAQKGEFGVRFMPTISNFDVQTSDGGTISGEATIGIGAGIVLGFNFTDHIGIQAEAIYNTLTQKYKEQDVEREIRLKYINIPLMLSYNTNKMKPVNFNVVAGPQIGISVGTELFTSNGNDPNDEAVLSVKKGDLGFAYGAGLDFGLNAAQTFRVGFGFRGVYGLFDISDNSQSLTTNSYYVLDRTHLKTYSGYAGVSFLF
jgi:hypothetical protein